MRKILLSTLILLHFNTYAQPDWAFDRAIKFGVSSAGVMVGERSMTDDPPLEDIETFKRKLDKKGYKLIDYSRVPSDSYDRFNKGKINSVAFSDKNNPKLDYYFRYSSIFPIEADSIITSTKNEIFYEGTGNNILGYGIQIGINKEKLPYVICGEIGKGAKTYTTTWFNNKEDALTSQLNFIDRYYFFEHYHCHYYLFINGQYKKVVDWSKIPHQWANEKDKYYTSFNQSRSVPIYMDYPQRHREVGDLILKMFREEMEDINKTSCLKKTKYLYAAIRYTNYLWSFLNLRDELTSIFNEYKYNLQKNEEKFTDPKEMLFYLKLVNELTKKSVQGSVISNYYIDKQKEYTQLVQKLNTDIAEDSKKTAEQKGILFRHTFQYGKIGEDYIPETYGYYNAGKKLQIGGIEIQEKDIKKYVKEGGYNKDIQGYTAIYQLINQSTNSYVIDVNVSCTVKMTDVQKHSWLSQLLSFSYSEDLF